MENHDEKSLCDLCYIAAGGLVDHCACDGKNKCAYHEVEIEESRRGGFTSWVRPRPGWLTRLVACLMILLSVVLFFIDPMHAFTFGMAYLVGTILGFRLGRLTLREKYPSLEIEKAIAQEFDWRQYVKDGPREKPDTKVKRIGCACGCMAPVGEACRGIRT